MPTIEVAKTIVVLTLPEESRFLIRDGKLKEGLAHQLFGEDSAAMEEVGALVAQLSDNQADFLLAALQHAVDEDHGHHASAHFLRLASEYELEGIGIEIRDDTVTEEKLFGPLRVMLVTWQPSEA